MKMAIKHRHSMAFSEVSNDIIGTSNWPIKSDRAIITAHTLHRVIILITLSGIYYI